MRPLLLSSLFILLVCEAARGQDTPDNRAQVVHVLNRITFGPRPGDVEMVEKVGVHNYIEQQLHPESIDDSSLEQEISKFALLQMTPQQLADVYATDYGKEAKQEKKEKKAAKANLANNGPVANSTPAMQPAAAPSPAVQDNVEMEPQPGAAPVPADQKARPAGAAGKTARDDVWHTDAAIGQLEQAKLVRAIDSQRQLQEVLADFWNNHFNIDVKKKTCRVTKITDDRDAIRAHLWGKFRDLLEASAKSPAMLFYLDNATNTAGPSVSSPAQPSPPMMAQATTPPKIKAKKQGGINENYAREIMELHTLGVDGGYTQQDVQEVARCFTGWGVDRQTGEFAFHAALHDNGAKIVLGHKIPAGGGMQDGETVLDILCASPACAHHISLELCQRFVADDPPATLVDRIAAVFTRTSGDLRQVTEAILTSPEFLAPASYGNKIKSPFEFTVSAVRATRSSIIAQQPPPLDKIVPTTEGRAMLGKKEAVIDRLSQSPRQSLNWHIFELGEPLFACTPPTGYKEVSSTWVSPGALIERLNFAMALTDQKLSDVRFDPKNILSGTDLDKPEDILNQCVAVLLQNNISDSTRKVLEKTAIPDPAASQTVNPSKLIALIIGSPEFQRK